MKISKDNKLTIIALSIISVMVISVIGISVYNSQTELNEMKIKNDIKQKQVIDESNKALASGKQTIKETQKKIDLIVKSFN